MKYEFVNNIQPVATTEIIQLEVGLICKCMIEDVNKAKVKLKASIDKFNLTQDEIGSNIFNYLNKTSLKAYQNNLLGLSFEIAHSIKNVIEATYKLCWEVNAYIDSEDNTEKAYIKSYLRKLEADNRNYEKKFECDIEAFKIELF